jgi:ABC-type phosphate transport system substrate-binding protein
MKKLCAVLLIIVMLTGVCACDLPIRSETEKSSETVVATTAEAIVAPTTEQTAAPTTKQTTEVTTKATTEAPPETTVDYETVLSGITLANYPKVDGSTATIPLAIGLIRAITGCSEAEAEESIDFHGTDPSYHQLADQLADLLVVYTAADTTVEELDIENTMELHEIGLDALVFIVNEDNPVDSLTADQVRDIFSGEITNWKEVGGLDQEIVAFQRPHLSGSQTLMLELMMKDTEMSEPLEEAISETMADIINDIAAYDNSANAIGYSVYYYAKNMFTQPGLKFIAIDGVLPSNETINSGEYGYTKPFYGVIPKEDPSPEARALLTYLLTPEGQQMLEDAGYVPILKKN